MRYMSILFTDLGVMHSMLAEISPDFVMCLRYEDIGDKETTARVADFIAPSKEVAKMLTKTLLRHARPHAGSAEEAFPFTHATSVAARVQEKLNVVDSAYC